MIKKSAIEDMRNIALLKLVKMRSPLLTKDDLIKARKLLDKIN